MELREEPRAAGCLASCGVRRPPAPELVHFTWLERRAKLRTGSAHRRRTRPVGCLYPGRRPKGCLGCGRVVSPPVGCVGRRRAPIPQLSGPGRAARPAAPPPATRRRPPPGLLSHPPARPPFPWGSPLRCRQPHRATDRTTLLRRPSSPVPLVACAAGSISTANPCAVMSGDRVIASSHMTLGW
jgi:hypothetical protein